MEVAFAGGAFAEIAGYNPGVEGRVLQCSHFERVSGAGGLGELSCQWGGDGVLQMISFAIPRRERGLVYNVEFTATVVNRHVTSCKKAPNEFHSPGY